jgi:hypothetical protein
VGESYLGGDAGGFGEVVDDLEVLQIILVDVLAFERVLQIEASGVSVLVLHPPSLLQCLLQVFVASNNNKDFSVFVDSVLLPPGGHVGDVQKNFVLRNVSLDEVLEG